MTKENVQDLTFKVKSSQHYHSNLRTNKIDEDISFFLSEIVFRTVTLSIKAT